MQTAYHRLNSQQTFDKSYRSSCIASLRALPDKPAAALAAQPQEVQQAADQTAVIRKLQQEAYEAGFKAGYQKGVQVQVNVSVELDQDSGSYLRRRQQQQQQRPQQQRSSEGGGSTSRQPWLPQAVKRGTTAAAAGPSSSTRSSPAGDSVVRSAVKGLVWRVFSTSATVLVVLVLLHDSLQASDLLKFGFVEFATKYVLYFLHERLWAQVLFRAL